MAAGRWRRSTVWVLVEVGLAACGCCVQAMFFALQHTAREGDFVLVELSSDWGLVTLGGSLAGARAGPGVTQVAPVGQAGGRR